jgi:hypothetical protein
MFSSKAVTQAQGLVLKKVLIFVFFNVDIRPCQHVRIQIDALCKALERESAAGKPTDLFWAFRCMTMDIITYLCFGSSVDAINAPGFQAPIIEAMDASLPVFVRFKHSELFKNMIMNCPPNLSKIVSPATRGLVDMQQMIRSQIQDLSQHPEKLDYLPHSMTIYHQLMDKEAYRTNTVPCEGSLYEETQALMFAGSDTTGNALMVGTFHLLRQPESYAKFKKEILSVWPEASAEAPTLHDLEALPYLNAVIKESLRLSVGVVSGLLRVVPREGAVISNVSVPGGVCLLSHCALSFLLIPPLANTDISYFRQLFPAAPPSSTLTQRFFHHRRHSVQSVGLTTPASTIGSYPSRADRECASASIWLGWSCGSLLRTYFANST